MFIICFVFFGIGLKLMVVLVFFVMNVFIKLVVDFLIGEIVFVWFIFVFILIFIMVVIMVDGVCKMVMIKCFWFYVWCLFLGMVVMFGYFMLIVLVFLVDVMVIGFFMLIFVVILVVVIFKEYVGVFRWGVVVVGLIGVLLIIELYGGICGLILGGFSYGVVFGLMGVFLVVFVVVFICQMSEIEMLELIVFYFVFFCFIVFGFIMFYDFKMLNVEEVFYLVVIGVFGGVV